MRNPDIISLGLYFIGIPLFILLLHKGLNAFFAYLDQRGKTFTKEIDSKCWPTPPKRTVKKILTFMSGKIGLLIWDIVTICLIISYLLTALVINKCELLFLAFLILFCFVIRIIFVLYYNSRNYTNKLLNNYNNCSGRIGDIVLLERLEHSLQNQLLFYSRQWIITEEFFLAWYNSNLLFNPIVIPLQEIKLLQFEVRRLDTNDRSVWNNVIVCQLKSGASLDLYIGDKYKPNVIVNILQYFSIPFENTLNSTEIYMPPIEITATSPNKRLSQEIKKEDLAIFAPVMNKTTAQQRKQILELLVAGQKIKAIKLLMDATGLGLAEAKAIVDQYYLK